MLRSKDYRQRIAFKKTIEDALYIDYGSGLRPGLFKELSSLRYHSPEFLLGYDYTVFDEMFLEYASEKWISKIAANYFYQVVDGELVHVDGMGELANALATIYSKNWDAIYNAYYESEYAPLENYDMKQKATYNSSFGHTGTETLGRSGTETHAKSGTDSLGRSGTETLGRGGTETLAKSGTDSLGRSGTETLGKSGTETLGKAGSEATNYNSETENQVSAFNSTEYQDANKAMHTGTDAISYGKNSENVSDPRIDTTTYNTTDTNTLNTTDTTTYNSSQTNTLNTTETNTLNTTDTTTYNSSDTNTLNTTDTTTFATSQPHSGYDELTRHGNIGVTTSQQMLQSEIDLRQYNFIMQVFRDITDYLGLPIY